MEIIKWLLLIGVSGFYFYRANKLSKQSGFLSGIDVILPTFWYLLFIVGWLILFFVIL